MLGLGDIVIPGTFVSLGLRYDYFRYTKAQPVGTFTKPYFIASLVAYVAGLATTMVVMHVFHAAQPALLYLRYDRHSLLHYARRTGCSMKWKQSCLHPLLCVYRLAPRGAHRSVEMERWSKDSVQKWGHSGQTG